MRILVIDTATPACSVALFDDSDLIDGAYLELGRGHAERLVPMIAELPEKGKAERVLVNVGPGSFTGIRVGISAARALSLAWKADCRGYGCLNLMAAMARSEEQIDVAMQGGHGQFFFQAFGADLTPKTELRSLTPEMAAEASSAPVVAGSAAESLVALRGSGKAIDMLPDARRWLLISSLPPLEPRAIYGRDADAKPMAATA